MWPEGQKPCWKLLLLPLLKPRFPAHTLMVQSSDKAPFHNEWIRRACVYCCCKLLSFGLIFYAIIGKQLISQGISCLFGYLDEIKLNNLSILYFREHFYESLPPHFTHHTHFGMDERYFMCWGKGWSVYNFLQKGFVHLLLDLFLSTRNFL